jgi:glutaminyl-tRNA synthetase
MPTISGLRRRGYTAESIRSLCTHVGVTKHNATTDMVVLENQIREQLNRTADRRMAVLDPLKVIITNYPEGQSETLEAVNNPEDPAAGSRNVPFGPEIYIEREDFMEDPPKKFFRLGPGREVRLRWAYFVKCHDMVKDADGNITEIHCTYDPETKGGNAPDGRKVKATLHWVSAADAVDAEVRLYDHLFVKEDPDDVEDESRDWQDNLNSASIQVMAAKLEPSLSAPAQGYRCQFERKGYFYVDLDSTPENPVFNRTTTLKAPWVKKKKSV